MTRTLEDTRNFRRSGDQRTSWSPCIIHSVKEDTGGRKEIEKDRGLGKVRASGLEEGSQGVRPLTACVVCDVT